jgi:SAM-dependent methyltransferase
MNTETAARPDCPPGSRAGEKWADSQAVDHALKHPRIMDLLCAPENPDGPPLRAVGSALAGAGWPVPVVKGIPDFVVHAPAGKRRLEIEIPIEDLPAPQVLQRPDCAGKPPRWFQEASTKYKILRDHPKGFLVDVGAGQGKRRTYETLGYDYVSLDISFDSRQSSQEPADIDIVADCHRLPLRSSRIEVVNCTAVLEHLYCPPLAVREMQRILKPGGLLVGSCSFLEGEHFGSQHHYSYLGLFRLLQASGLRVMHIFPGISVWEAHSGSIYFNLPFHKLMGRLHRRLYLLLVKCKSKESAALRLLRHAGVLHFIAKKTETVPGMV